MYFIKYIGFSIISLILGVCAISIIYLFSIIALLNGIALNIPLIYDYQKSYYYQDLQSIWQYDWRCAQADINLIYSPKFGKCSFNNPEFKTTLNFDEQGRFVPARKNSNLNEKGIVLLGDSHTMGWGVNDEETFANILQVNTKKPVFNLGVSSYGTERELKRFALSGLVDKVDTVVIQYSENDHGENLTDPKDVYAQEKVAGFKEVLETADAQKKAISKKDILKKHIYRALHIPYELITKIINQPSLDALLDFKINNKQIIQVLNRYEDVLKNKQIYIFYVNGHGVKFSNFQSGPSSTGENFIYLDSPLVKNDFYLLDDHLTAGGQKKLGLWLANSIAISN